MHKTLLLLVVAPLAGCSAPSLQRYALNQSMTITEMRYQQIMQGLAAVADNAGRLPSFALTAGGLANVTNTASIDSATVWAQAMKGFSSETLGIVGQHNPELQWTLDPVVSRPQLEAIRYAFTWAVYGPPPVGSRAREMLRALTVQDITDCPADGMVKQPPGYHFGVEEQLCRIPTGWLHIAKTRRVPKEADFYCRLWKHLGLGRKRWAASPVGVNARNSRHRNRRFERR